MSTLPVLLPQVLSSHSPSETQRVLQLRVSPELVHFAGHFADFPVLPGVVQLDWAAHYASEQWADLAAGTQFQALDNLKFQALIRPGARLELHLQWDAPRGRLSFSYQDAGGKLYSSGRLQMLGAQGE